MADGTPAGMPATRSKTQEKLDSSFRWNDELESDSSLRWNDELKSDSSLRWNHEQKNEIKKKDWMTSSAVMERLPPPRE